MACIKGIALAFTGFREAANPPVSPKAGKIILAASKYFMDIGLVAYILYNFILREVKT